MVTQNPSQDPSTFGWSVGKNIVPYSYIGPGAIPIVGTPFPGGVARGTEKVFDHVLDQLVPLIQGGLNSGSCFGYENRNKVGSSGKSFHAYGLALDINASSNGQGLKKGRTGKYVIPDAASSIAASAGCEWGGDWKRLSDPMHIEVHMTPEQCAAFTGDNAVVSTDNSVTATAAAAGIDPKLIALGGIVIIGGIIVFSQVGGK